MTPKSQIFAITLLFIFLSCFVKAQTTWNTAGNSATSTSIFGTTNNQPLVFYTNGTETMRMNTNGTLRINNLSGTGNNFVFSNSTGVLFKHAFSNDSTKLLTEAGTFRTAASITGLKIVGNNIYFLNSGFIGMGTTNPQYTLDV